MGSDKKITVGKFTTNHDEKLITQNISRIIPEGVYVFTETVAFGHVFVLVSKNKKIIAYTYGRYTSDTSQGVLLRYQDTHCTEYLMKELYIFNSNVFEITDVKPDPVIQIFDSIWDSSSAIPPPGKTKYIETDGKIIDEYKLLSRNCTTITCDALKQAGTKIFDKSNFLINCEILYENMAPQIKTPYISNKLELFQEREISCAFPDEKEFFIDPEALEDYLKKLSGTSLGLVNNYTYQMRILVPNRKNYKYEPFKYNLRKTGRSLS